MPKAPELVEPPVTLSPMLKNVTRLAGPLVPRKVTAGLLLVNTGLNASSAWPPDELGLAHTDAINKKCVGLAKV